MKKLILSVIALLTGIGAIQAQDTIVKRNESADEIKAKVIEIGDDKIRYKRYDNLDGPIYSIARSEVFFIRYENGQKEVFKRATTKVGANGYPYPVIRNTYIVGDYFEEGDIKGVVLQVTDGGRHGLIVSLCETRDCPFSDPQLLKEHNWQNEEIGCDDWKDGWKNRQRWEAYIAERGLPAECYPAMEWCRSLGPGWYLPAEEELNLIFAAFSKDGNFPKGIGSCQRAISELNDRLSAYGGDSYTYRFFISSTEADAQRIYRLCDFRTRKPLPIKKSSTTLNSVRAFHKF